MRSNIKFTMGSQEFQTKSRQFIFNWVNKILNKTVNQLINAAFFCNKTA